LGAAPPAASAAVKLANAATWSCGHEAWQTRRFELGSQGDRHN
jgi:hypothetical protein